jgi:pyruvate dehydrogenase E1 component beta subunit/2-oxoisovalerate dehydrogenase E1 component
MVQLPLGSETAEYAMPDAVLTPESEAMTGAAALNSALDHALATDPRVVLLGEDIADPSGGVFKITKGLSTKYGEDRVRDTPIAETAILGAAVGLALNGFRPVAEIMFFDFTTVAIDQLVNHAAKLRYMSGGHTPVPLVVRTTVGQSRFGAQHSQSLEAWFMHTPGLKVVMPSNPAEYKGLLLGAIADDDPVLFIEHINLYYGAKEPIPGGNEPLPLGSARTLRSGTDITLITYGPAVRTCLAAADELATAGVSAEVIDLRSLVPLDMATLLESVERTRCAAVVHEATQFCGPGAEIAAQLTDELFGELRAPVARVGAKYSPTPFSPALNGYPTPESVTATAKQLLGL